MVLPDLVSEGYSKSDLGLIMAAMAVSYGLSNFFMGFVADRFSIKWLMPACLVLSALVSLVLAVVTGVGCPLIIIALLMACNGWVQGVGWPCSAKVIAHWYRKRERGQATSFWNLSNNLGAGLLGPLAIGALLMFSAWQAKLVIPAVIALLTAGLSCYLLRERPEDSGLPELPDDSDGFQPEKGEEDGASGERSFMGFCRVCLRMPQLWVLALINVCIYFIRYGVLDWVPLYMTEERHFSFEVAGWAFFAFEFAAIPGTLLCGFITDKLFGGRRVPMNLLFMSLALLALTGYWHSEHSSFYMPILMLMAIGFLIYGCVAISHVHMIDIAPKRYVAAAVGFCGLFGYLLGASGSNLILGRVIDSWGWDGAFQLILCSGIIAVILLLVLWYQDGRTPGAGPVSVDLQDPSSELKKGSLQNRWPVSAQNALLKSP